MAESAALLVDKVLPEQPVPKALAALTAQALRQWVLSFPFQLRFLFASRPEIMGRMLGMVYRVVATHLVKKTGYTKKSAQTGAVTLIQRFGSALNLNIHFHMLFLDGAAVEIWGANPDKNSAALEKLRARLAIRRDAGRTKATVPHIRPRGCGKDTHRATRRHDMGPAVEASLWSVRVRIDISV